MFAKQSPTSTRSSSSGHSDEPALVKVRYTDAEGRVILRRTDGPCGYAAGDVNLYRYVRSRPVGSTDPSGLWEQGSGGESGKKWAPTHVGGRKWTSADGKFSVDAELKEIREKSIVLKKADGSEVEVPMDQLAANDRLYVLGQRVMPANIKMDSSTISDAHKRRQWEEAVYRDIGALSELSDGAKLLDDIAQVAKPTEMFFRGKKVGGGRPINDTPIILVPREGGDNHTLIQPPRDRLGGSQSVRVHYSPFDTQGDLVEGGGSRERPAFLSLGKELSTGNKALRGPIANVMEEERRSAAFENLLRDQYNRVPGNRQLPHRRLP